MTTLEKSASARLPVARFWVERGEGLARAAVAVVARINVRVGRVFSALGRVYARSVALRELHALDDRMLQDIGLRRDQVGVTVDAMVQRNKVARATQPSRELEAADTSDDPALDVSNDRRYKSAA